MNEIAQTIFSQLGGNRFVVMTGARNFVAGENSLSFRFPQPGTGKPNGCMIKLTPLDEYDVTFFYTRRIPNPPRIIEQHQGIYCDMLRPIFEKATGLYVSLGSMGRSA